MLEKNYYRSKPAKNLYQTRSASTYTERSYVRSVQDPFLNYCVREGTEVNLILKNDGVKNGIIRGFDNWSILISDKDENVSLIFKSGISAITPADEINWLELVHPGSKVPLVADSRAHHTDYFA